MKTIEVVAAIFKKDDTYLCMQRKEGPSEYISKKYEFPGGKIEVGEPREFALQRELKEELDIDIMISSNQFFMTVDHTYPDFRIIMHGFLIEVQDLQFEMNDHKSFQWTDKENLHTLDWASADIPFVEKIMKEI
jgi:8-oxo-dGTP diphosphatase